MEIPIKMIDLEFRGITILGKKPTYQKIQIDIALYKLYIAKSLILSKMGENKHIQVHQDRVTTGCHGMACRPSDKLTLCDGKSPF